MRALLALLVLVACAQARAVTVDSIVLDGTGDIVNRASEDPNLLLNNDAQTHVFFFEKDTLNTQRFLWGLFRQATALDYLLGLRVETTNVLTLRDSNGAGGFSSTTATISANTWYAICIRQTAAGATELNWYAMDGTLIEREAGTNTNNGFTGATDLNYGIGARWNGSSGTVDQPLNGEIALPNAWRSDRGQAGCDAWAADPLNYVAANPPDYFQLHDADGDIVISTTIQDQSGQGRHFALVADAAFSNGGGPTVDDLVVADGEFDVTPSLASNTSTDSTITGSLDAAGTAHAVSCVYGRAAPTVANVQSGLCKDAAGTGTEAALDTDTDAPSMGAFNFSLELGPGNGWPIHKWCVTDGATVVCDDDLLDVPMGFNRAVLGAIDMTSPFFGVLATGDILQIANSTTPNGYATDADEDGTIFYLAGGDTSRQFIDADAYDVSAGALLDFTLVFNNLSPTLVDDWQLTSALFEVSTAWSLDPATGEFSDMDGVLVDGQADVQDPESDDLSWSVESGDLPDGTCGPFEFTARAADPYGGLVDLQSRVDIGAVIPDVEGQSGMAAKVAIEALCSLTTVPVDGCSSDVEPGFVIRTSPLIGTLVEADAEVQLVLSTGECPVNVPAGSNSISIRIGIGM